MSVLIADKIETWPLTKLIPFDKNPVIHPPEQILDLVDLITEVGFLVPILVDSSQGIVAGHGRLMAAKKMGLTKVPVIVCDHLTPAQIQAYRIADNKVAQKSSWNHDLLKVNFDELKALKVDLPTTGFSQGELNDILNLEVVLPQSHKPPTESANAPSQVSGDQKKKEEEKKQEPKIGKSVRCPKCDHEFLCQKT